MQKNLLERDLPKTINELVNTGYKITRCVRNGHAGSGARKVQINYIKEPILQSITHKQ